MEKVKQFFKDQLHWFIVGGVALLCALFLTLGTPDDEGYITVGGKVTIDESTTQFINDARKATITYAETAVPAVIVNSEGEEETIDVPTVESIDGGEIGETCADGEECGLGAYIYAPTDTFENFKNYTLGKCWNVDGSWDEQCWDLAALHWMNYTKDGRTFSTCGTGAVKNSWNCKEYNAGTEYELIYNASEIKTGDWVITGAGTYGHVCEAAGPYNNGYVACLGQNQSGTKCPGSVYGSATNIINLGLGSFVGAFRPKTYTDPTPPQPTPAPVSDCSTWNVQKGDTMSGIMLACKGYVDWSQMNNYADKWISQMINPGKSIYWGWTHGTGYGLFSGDIIQYSE